MKFLILIVGLVILYFLKKLTFSFIDDEFNVKSQGGMKKKYAVLIEHLMHCEPRLKILEESNTYIAVGIVGMAGSQIYHFTHICGKVEIVMRMKDNPLWGNMEMKWDFPETMDQQEMIRIMDKDLAEKFNPGFDMLERMGIPYNVKSHGGMKEKYAILIEYLMSADPQVKIIEESTNHIVVGIMGAAEFHITHFLGTLEIVMPHSPLWGNTEMKWEFPENMDQQAMIRVMDKDIADKFSEKLKKMEGILSYLDSI